MRQRVDKLARIVQLSEHQRRAAEWRLAGLQRQRFAAAAEEAAIFAALNAEVPLHGLFVEAMAKRLRQIAERLATLARAEEAQTLKLQSETSRLKRSERIFDKAVREHERARDWKELAEQIEATLAREGASLP